MTAERGGLHASLTRTVAFDPPDWIDERVEAATAVETVALRATRVVGEPGGAAADVFDAIWAAYEAVGHEGEWRTHHQVGAAGYAGREWIATPDAADDVVRPMAYAWNPTVQGTKSENTWLVDGDGIEPLTPGTWGRRSVAPPTDVVAGGALDHPVSLLDGR